MSEQEIPKDWFEFMQKAWNPMSLPLPGMMTPTVDAEEIKKKVADLKAVETWLTMNTGLVQMTVKALEMQLSALDSLQTTGPSSAQGAAPPKNPDGK